MRWFGFLFIATLLFATIEKDFTQDGITDRLVRYDTLELKLHILDSAQMIQETINYGKISQDWSLLDVADINGDGYLDYIWRNENTRMYVWYMNAQNLKSSASYLPAVSLNWELEAVYDMNSDAKDDFLWRNAQNGMLVVWLNNAQTHTTQLYQKVATNWKIVAVEDINGDGEGDFFWRDEKSNLVVAWLNNGTTHTLIRYQSVLPDWQIMAMEDVNGDGQDDIIWQNSKTLQKVAWTLGATFQKVSLLYEKDWTNGNSSSSLSSVSTAVTVGSDYQVIAWNDLGMHCMDGNDYSVFSILPPFNTLLAQVVQKGSEPRKVSSGVTLTYEAYPSLDGKLNSSTANKTNFWDYILSLFGVRLNDNEGLTGNSVQSLAPQAMHYNSATSLWEATGIPTSPKNDDGTTNYYPMVKVSAKDASGNILSQTTTVLPVSDEMDCRSCHNSATGSSEAKPTSGWENHTDSEKDYKLNILRLHDERHDVSPYLSSLAQQGYNYSASLYETAQSGTPILCASCHKSNALATTGFSGIASLSSVIHSKHANALSLSGRNNCYKCHPGSKTSCLRGAMGNVKNSDGSYKIDCQSCHGDMEAVGAHSREAWLNEPDCESCHYDGKRESVAVTNYQTGTLRSALMDNTQNTFATNSGKLFKDSKGHGGLQCSVCHGSTHAIYPSSKPEDNLQNERIQGYEGTLSNCASCHKSMVYTTNEGPHGLHQIGESWVRNHEDVAEHSGTQSCTVCHGQDYRGSFLSKMFETRVMEGKTFAKGHEVSCYDCHNGPSGE